MSQRPDVRLATGSETCALTQYGVPDPARMVFTSYAGVIGSLPVLAQPLPSTNCVVPPALIAQCNGVFNDLSPIRLASVPDGLGNTIFLAEKATTILQELNALNPQYAAQHGWYITGNWGDTLTTSLYPPNACDKVAPVAMTAWTNSASSMHPGGLNVLMGDGSVRFIKDSIQSWPFNPISGNPAATRRMAKASGSICRRRASGRHFYPRKRRDRGHRRLLSVRRPELFRNGCNVPEGGGCGIALLTPEPSQSGSASRTLPAENHNGAASVAFPEAVPANGPAIPAAPTHDNTEQMWTTYFSSRGNCRSLQLRRSTSPARSTTASSSRDG